MEAVVANEFLIRRGYPSDKRAERVQIGNSEEKPFTKKEEV
jgi:hypothetical protein